MIDIKYIYFEVNYITGCNETEPEIVNENILLIKPHTNSFGVWGFLNITERLGFEKRTFSIVHQYWIDLERFHKVKHSEYNKYKTYVDAALNKIQEKINSEIL